MINEWGSNGVSDFPFICMYKKQNLKSFQNPTRSSSTASTSQKDELLFPCYEQAADWEQILERVRYWVEGVLLGTVGGIGIVGEPVLPVPCPLSCHDHTRTEWSDTAALDGLDGPRGQFPLTHKTCGAEHMIDGRVAPKIGSDPDATPEKREKTYTKNNKWVYFHWRRRQILSSGDTRRIYPSWRSLLQPTSVSPRSRIFIFSLRK